MAFKKVKSVVINNKVYTYTNSHLVNKENSVCTCAVVLFDLLGNIFSVVFDSSNIYDALEKVSDLDYENRFDSKYKPKLSEFIIQDCEINDYKNINGVLEIPFTFNGINYDYDNVMSVTVSPKLFLS